MEYLRFVGYAACFVNHTLLFVKNTLRFVDIIITPLQLEDVVGLPSGLCNKGVGALTGACPWCTQGGCRMHGTTKYIGAITHTHTRSPLRQRFQQEFKDTVSWTNIQDMHRATPPGQMTTDEALRSGRKMKRAREGSDLTATELRNLQKEEPYTDVDAFSTRFPGWNKLRRTVVDPAHELMNLVKDILHLIVSMKDTSMAFTKARKEEEAKNGRFMDGQVLIVLICLRFVNIKARFVNITLRFACIYLRFVYVTYTCTTFCKINECMVSRLGFCVPRGALLKLTSY